MALVVLQPAGSVDSKKHYEQTVTNVVALDAFAGLPPADLEVLRAAFTEGELRVWGVTPAVDGSNVNKHAKIQAGDFVLFAEKNAIFSAATVRHAFRSEAIAENIWGRDTKGQTWELMFAIDPTMYVRSMFPFENSTKRWATNLITASRDSLFSTLKKA